VSLGIQGRQGTAALERLAAAAERLGGRAARQQGGRRRDRRDWRKGRAEAGRRCVASRLRPRCQPAALSRPDATVVAALAALRLD